MKLTEVLQQKEIQEKIPSLKTVGELYELIKGQISLEELQEELRKKLESHQEQMSLEELEAVNAAGLSWGDSWGDSWGNIRLGEQDDKACVKFGDQMCVSLG